MGPSELNDPILWGYKKKVIGVSGPTNSFVEVPGGTVREDGGEVSDKP